jgi:PAS domain-containing protein
MRRALELGGDPLNAGAGSLLEFVWPLTALAMFVALFLSWYLRILDIPMVSISAIMASVATVHALLPPLLPRSGEARNALLLAAHLTAVAALAYVWCVLGGLAMPLFLLFFAAPTVAASAHFTPWGRQAAFIFELLAVAVAAAVASPALRWYSAQQGIPLDWLDPLEHLVVEADRFTEVRPEPALECASLVLAAGALIALHLSAGAIADIARRLHLQLRRMVTSLHEDKGLLGDLLRSSFMPEALVLTDSRRIVLVSDRFREYFARPGQELEGADLRSAVDLQFPEALEPLLAGSDGQVDCQFRGPDGAMHPARAHLVHLSREGARMMRFTLEPCEDSRQLELALATLERAVLVIDGAGTIARANEAARALFPLAMPGAPAHKALHAADLPSAWWQSQPGSSVPRDFSINGRRVRGRVVCRGADAQSAELIVVELSAEPRA